MHKQAMDWFRKHLGPAKHNAHAHVLDIGGRNMNGSVRELLPDTRHYTSVDIADGPGVDFVADATDPLAFDGHIAFYDIVVCAEVFEHCEDWRRICVTAHNVLMEGGVFIVTCAGPGRTPHSGRRASLKLDPDEFYQNVTPDELVVALDEAGFSQILVDRTGKDVRAVARK